MIHNREMINPIIEARAEPCFLHKATIAKIKAKIQQIIPNIPPTIVRHNKPQTNANTKLAIANQLDFFVSSILKK
jgi:hypothetical protein